MVPRGAVLRLRLRAEGGVRAARGVEVVGGGVPLLFLDRVGARGSNPPVSDRTAFSVRPHMVEVSREKRQGMGFVLTMATSDCFWLKRCCRLWRG